MLQITHTPLKLSLFLWCLSLHWFDGLHTLFSIMRTGLYRCVFVSEDILRFIVSKMNGIAWIATLSMFHMAQNPWVRRCYAMPRANSISPASAQFSGSNKTASLHCDSWYFQTKKTTAISSKHLQWTLAITSFFLLSLLAPLPFSSACVRNSQ